MDLNFLSFPIVLLIAGIILLLIGLLGRIRIKDFEGGTDSVPIRVVTASFGIALLLAAFIVNQSDKPPPPDNSNTAKINTPPTPSPTPHNTPAPTSTPTPTLPKPDVLIEIITKQQHDNVRESYGESAGQNFTERDLDNFIKKGKLADITAQLKTDAEFLDVMLAIKRMPASERQKLLNKGLNTHRPTWEQLGGINKEGQTKAGQDAERMIAAAIVKLATELSKKSEEDIQKLKRGDDQD